MLQDDLFMGFTKLRILELESNEITAIEEMALTNILNSLNSLFAALIMPAACDVTTIYRQHYDWKPLRLQFWV